MPDWGRDNDVSLGTVDLPVEVSPTEVAASKVQTCNSAVSESARGDDLVRRCHDQSLSRLGLGDLVSADCVFTAQPVRFAEHPCQPIKSVAERNREQRCAVRGVKQIAAVRVAVRPPSTSRRSDHRGG